MSTLTRLYINPHKRGAAKLLANPQAMHAAVRSAFPPDIDESSARVLWRVDNRQHEHILYIVGPEKPEVTHIVEQAGWDTRPGQSLDYSRFLAQIKKGQRWAFEVVANPVQAVSQPGQSRGKILPHVTVEQQLNWLVERGPTRGFCIPQSDGQNLVRVAERKDLRFRKQSGSRPVVIRTARFGGVLEVTDADVLRTTLTQGLGRARAYGCGLLTLAPVEG
ncbi:type I-E CRISPR-associated protein Cas6/Cse3/CasE [Corynebacterium lizhenjunii]|uniref:Type I-E CRISPR-associated protein Cas6/Cse3/CasE n=1 Tax=Corynebacterium lizhenjunii TaxID=2709394 RepID=A0A7T0PBS1_9CORY|nr:type I-E CRISPR-associated protein Cas6/Cse3/CasE [Corynebacterium lizhenjunii]QPK78812.1 type I-E CRISPR-associated protein Cas6/Cse3/CasE [Corynebacterium lizhenjunii]